MSTDEGNCVICFEPLLSDKDSDVEIIDSSSSHSSQNNNHQAIGACVPCGHVFHVNCFEQWRRTSNSRRRCKCPMCNQPEKDFVKLFLELPQTSNTQDLLCTNSHMNADDNNDDDDLDLAKAEVVHKRFHSLRQQVQSYQTKCQTLKDKLGKQTESLREKNATIEDYEQQLQDARSDRLVEQEMHQAQERQLEALRLQVVQTNRKCIHLQHDHERISSERDALRDELAQAQARFEVALQKASASSLTEVQHILQQHPKLVQENQTLKQKLQKLQQQLRSVTSATISLATTSISTTHARQSARPKSASSSSSFSRRALLQNLGGKSTNQNNNDTRRRPPSQPSPCRKRARAREESTSTTTNTERDGAAARATSRTESLSSSSSLASSGTTTTSRRYDSNTAALALLDNLTTEPRSSNVAIRRRAPSNHTPSSSHNINIKNSLLPQSSRTSGSTASFTLTRRPLS